MVVDIRLNNFRYLVVVTNLFDLSRGLKTGATSDVIELTTYGTPWCMNYETVVSEHAT